MARWQGRILAYASLIVTRRARTEAGWRRIRPLAPLSIVAVAAGFAWACGDGSSGEEASPPPAPTTPATPLRDAAPPPDGDIPPPDGGISCAPPPRPSPTSKIDLVPVFTNVPDLELSYPLGLFQAPGDDTTWYEVEQTGHIRKFTSTTAPVEMLAAPLGSDIGETWEGGLLGFAFHPDYATNGTAFLAYTVRTASPGLTQRVGRFKLNAGGLLEKDVDLLDLPVPAGSVREEHNVGTLTFGPDGYLYIGLGDAYVLGSNPQNPAQDPNSLFGKILRIAVGDSGPYTIPPTNPYAGGGGAPEIYARGFRNPWRFSFDRGNPAHLWVADVGDDTWEEINRVELGKNYGWSVMEGAECHAATTCDKTGLELPIATYQHKLGLLAVIGGYVYRGTQHPSLVGTYFYGDYSGRIWSLPNGQAPARVEIDTGLPIVSFAQDNAGELYVLTLETPSSPGKILRIVATPPAPPSQVPKTLSATGCFEPSAPTNPVSTLVPYDINSPLWSDGAEKRRWMSIPPGAKIHVRDDGDLEPPIGTVLVKEFRLQGKPVETRLFVRHVDGDWGGYTYEWADDGSDAHLLDAEKFKQVGAVEWFFPSTPQCLRCHTKESNRSLGLEIAQLNRSFTYPDGTTANQLTRLEQMGLLDKAIGDPTALPRYPDPLGTDPVEARARSYLHANCAFCHRPGASPRTKHDLLFTTPFAATQLCDEVTVVSDFGNPDMRLLKPGDPSLSALSIRMKRVDGMRMPPLASSVVDTAGVAVIDAWIQSIATCP